MRLRSLVLLVLWLPASGFAAFEFLNVSPRSAAMAGVGVAGVRANSALNPAHCLNRSNISLNYYRPFQLPEIQAMAVHASGRFRGWGGGISIRALDHRLYHEQVFQAAAAVSIEQLRVGGRLGYGLIDIANYGHTQTMMLDVGAAGALTEFLHWGVCIQNAGFAKLGPNGEPLPQRLQLGFCLDFDSLVFSGQLDKETDFAVDYALGAMFRLVDLLSLRAGVGTMPGRMSAGFTLHLFQADFDYAYVSTAGLATMHQFAVQFNF